MIARYPTIFVNNQNTHQNTTTGTISTGRF